MSDVAPPGETPGATQAGTNPPASAGGGTRLSIGAVVGIALAVLAIAGVGGYLIGHSKGESSGDSTGVAAGKQDVLATYQPGQPGYQKIYTAGKQAGFAQGKQQGEQAGKTQGEAQGKQVGFEQGDKQGITTGDSEGVRQGAAAVLGGFGTWTVGSYYVVTMEAGTSAGVAYTIGTRTQLQQGTNYRICQSGGSTQLCESPVAGSASAGGGTANAGGAN
ncbi:MAG TPA: hypothetical protein VFF79_01390 [Conexibacter sp.]|jgi:hypothetical protein|nr:hypothetical protein [Conexibacter sp.]